MSETSGELKDVLRLRRGVGTVYVAAGVLHWAEMALALLIATHRLQVSMTPRLWSQLFFAHFLLLVVTGSLYLIFSYYRSGLFTFPALVDYIVGIPPFMIGFPIAVGAMLGGAPLAVGFLPGAFLVFYGAGLRSGRAMGFFSRPRE